jgi:hypothetical protein
MVLREATGTVLLIGEDLVVDRESQSGVPAMRRD